MDQKKEIETLDRQYIAATYKRFDLFLSKGQGSLAEDESGKTYIDLGAGIAVNTFGYCDPIWIEAVTKQLSTLQHTSNLYYTAPCARLAEALCQRTGFRKVFFSNSGAEANECAIKAARKYMHDRYPGVRQTILTLKNSFHGRTIATLAATGQEGFHQHFGPFPAGFDYVDADDTDATLARMAKPDVGAIFIELVQGEGGLYVLPKAFVTAIYDYCRAHDILLLVDEVQTGNGRTGTLYAYEQFGIQPDILSTAKGLAGGLPLGATLFGEKTADVLCAGDHGSTFGGNPVAAAGALSILERLDETLLGQVREKSEFILSELSCAKGVRSVSGLGLMLGIEPERPAAEIIAGCQARGVLCLTAKQKIRLLPALNIPDALLKQAILVLKEELAK